MKFETLKRIKTTDDSKKFMSMLNNMAKKLDTFYVELAELTDFKLDGYNNLIYICSMKSNSDNILDTYASFEHILSYSNMGKEVFGLIAYNPETEEVRKICNEKYNGFGFEGDALICTDDFNIDIYINNHLLLSGDFKFYYREIDSILGLYFIITDDDSNEVSLLLYDIVNCEYYTPSNEEKFCSLYWECLSKYIIEDKMPELSFKDLSELYRDAKRIFNDERFVELTECGVYNNENFD